MEGQGLLTLKDGRIFNGHFENGELSGEGYSIDEDGHKYEVILKDRENFKIQYIMEKENCGDKMNKFYKKDILKKANK